MFITEARDLPRSVAVLEIMRIPVRVAAGNGNEFPGSGKGSGVSGYAAAFLWFQSSVLKTISQMNFKILFAFVHKVCVSGTSVGMFYIKVLVLASALTNCSGSLMTNRFVLNT